MSKILGRPLYAPAPAGGGKPSAPKFTYDGDYVIRDDGVVELLTSGTITFLNPAVIDVFMVGGGSSGRSGYNSSMFGCGGGAGGYTQTVRQFKVVANNEYPVTIGDGGLPAPYGKLHGNPGGSTSFGTFTVKGGSITPGNSNTASGYSGGSGGGGGVSSNSGYGAGGSDGANGEQGYMGSKLLPGGKGQNSTTREFGELTGKLYAGGGGGGRHIKSQTPVVSMGGDGGGGNGGWSGGGIVTKEATAGGANTGGGGGGGSVNNSGSYVNGAAGGSGIVCFRESQELPELAGTWVLNERLYAPEFGPSAIGKQTSQAVTFTAGSDTFTSFVFYWPSVNDNNLYYQNSAKTTVIYNFISNTYYNGVIKTITFPAGATASDEFRAWLASNATKQTA